MRPWLGRAVPAVLVAALLFVIAIPSLALPAVQLWGANWYGQLGDSTTINRRWAVQPPAWPPDTTALAGGYGHTLVLRAGVVGGAGFNGFGQLGDGTFTDRLTVVPVVGITDAVAIAAGGYHSMALLSNGTVMCWGYNGDGELGDGTATNSNIPVQVLTATGGPLTGVVAIAAGTYHSMALLSDGTVMCWGMNNAGQLGDGTTTSSPFAQPVPNLSGVVAVDGGGLHSLALLREGYVRGWGYNGYGQLGDGTTTDRLFPVPMLEAPTGPPVSGVVAIAAGGYHSVLQRQDGTVWTCGYNGYGQLGDGSYADRLNPVPVPGMIVAPPRGIDAGTMHTAAIDPAGGGWTWGLGYYGQLGDGSWSYSPSPVSVYALTGVSAIACGDYHTLAIADSRAATSLYVPDRTGTMTETIFLRAYLKRVSDGAWLVGRTVDFFIDGSSVGSAVTNATGRADLAWVVWGGAATRTITGEYGGEVGYRGITGTGTATCLTWRTKMATFDRTARITDRTELKCRLLRSDNAPIYNRNINFYVDGTFVITRPTNVSGYASFPFYDVPDGAGAGVRPILSEWVGDAGYAAISKTANLTVLKAIPYIWVLNKSVPLGGIANLYAYFRRLYDYQKQVGKSVDFKIDGTWVQTVTTDAVGVARYLYRTVEPVGSHTITCEFAGDAWLDPGSGSGTLTIY